MMFIAKRRHLSINIAINRPQTLGMLAERYIGERKNVQNHVILKNEIYNIDFSFNFNRFTDLECLLLLRFRKKDIVRLIPVIAWPVLKLHTSRNRYAVTPILATCILLRRLATPARWTDLIRLFGKWPPQMSEIFWESLEHMLHYRKHLITDSIGSDFMRQRAEMYAGKVFEKCGALTNVVGFIDGTVIGITRPKGSAFQRVIYNGHKRKHALKYQAINAPDGLMLHVAGPIEGRRHDWTLYIRTDLERTLPKLLDIDGVRYCIYGDSGYSRRWYLEVPFQGATLTAAQRAFNSAMSEGRITVEWMFKETKMYFTTVDFKRKMKLFESPIGLLYLSSMLMSNFRNCIYPNQVAQYFGCEPPNLEEYVAHKN